MSWSRYLRGDGSPLSDPRRLRINSCVSGWRMRRFSSSTKATCVPFLIEYLRRSFEGMTNWPLVVTVETSVFMRTPESGGLREKDTECQKISQIPVSLPLAFNVRTPPADHPPP